MKVIQVKYFHVQAAQVLLINNEINFFSIQGTSVRLMLTNVSTKKTFVSTEDLVKIYMGAIGVSAKMDTEVSARWILDTIIRSRKLLSFLQTNF